MLNFGVLRVETPLPQNYVLQINLIILSPKVFILIVFILFIVCNKNEI